MREQTKDRIIGSLIVGTIAIWMSLVLIIGFLNLQSNTRIEKLLTPVEGIE